MPRTRPPRLRARRPAVTYAELLGFITGLASVALAVVQRVETFDVSDASPARLERAVAVVDAILARGWNFG